MVAGVGEGDGYGGYRSRLVETLQQKGIRDLAVLRAIGTVPRHLFVPEDLQAAAYADHPLAIGQGQTISQPFIVALMTDFMDLKATDKVLEIGTGSGYQAAVLSHLCRRVYTVERWRELQKAAELRLAELKINNVTTIIGDGWLGWPPQAPFDRIIVTAAALGFPEALTAQLEPDGRMILPIGRRLGRQRLVLVTMTPGGAEREDLIAVRFVPLVTEK